jgi:hypothetical protein
MRAGPADGDRCVSVLGPLRDRSVGAGTGQHRADGEEEDRLQTVTAPASLPWIRNSRQRLQQRDRLDQTQRLGWHASLCDGIEQDGRGR